MNLPKKKCKGRTIGMKIFDGKNNPLGLHLFAFFFSFFSLHCNLTTLLSCVQVVTSRLKKVLQDDYINICVGLNFD